MNDQEKDVAFANRMYRDPGVLAVGVGSTHYHGPTTPRPAAGELSLIALRAAADMAGTGYAQLDIRCGVLKALAICYAEQELVVAVIIETGNPVSKSLQRMVRRAMKVVYGIPHGERPATAVPAPVTDLPTAEVR